MKLLLCIITALLLSGCHFSRMNYQRGMVDFKLHDYRDAFVRLKPEAERGNPEAEYAIGYMYYYGQGVYEDRNRATYWIQRSARQGNPHAVAALDVMLKERVDFRNLPQQ